MAATVAVLGSALTTTAGNKTVTATPTVGDLIVIITVSTGVATTIADNGTGGTYTQVDSTRTGFSTSGNLQMWVRNALVSSATSTTYTATQTSSTGGGLMVLRVTGVTATGASAVRSSGGQSTGTAGTTPAPVLSLTPLSTNLIISAVANASNATTTVVQRTGYTEDFDNGYNTPATGLEVAHLLSGETSATLTQGGTSATAFASSAIEIIVNQPPTVALNAPADTGTVVTTTPQLTFTGTDADSDAITYEVQVDTVNTFTSQSVTNNKVNSYETGQDSGSAIWSGDSGQSFKSLLSGTLKIGTAYLKKTGIPSGNATFQIFAHSGTYGSTGVPTGTALATSATLDVSTLTTSYAFIDLAFSGINQISLTAGTPYFLVVDYTGGTSTDNISWGVDTTSPTAGGNAATNPSGWSASATWDFLFKVFADTQAPLLDKLSNTDTGFTDITNGAHTDPFTSGEQIGYTVQAGDALTNGNTYYWRVRGKDPSGANTYGAWPTTQSFTVSSGTSAAVTQVAATVTAAGGTQSVTAVSSAAITQSAGIVTASGGTQTVVGTIVASASITQVAANVTATGGTQTIATVNKVAITQVAGVVTATGGIQAITAIVVASASITQVAATVTAAGGTQALATINDVSIAQVAASVTASGGTQALSTINIVALTQLAGTVTASGGTQAIASVQNSAITQVAGVVTASGGTQVISTGSVVSASITQSAATVTASSGTQVVASVNIVAVSQLAATVTTTGGTQSIATVNNVSLAQVAGTVTASGGTQAVDTVNVVALSQAAGTVTASGGTQAIDTVNYVTITQSAAAVTVTGGTQAIAAYVNTSVVQVAATVTAAGGIQDIFASSGTISAAITQVTANVTATGGTAVITTSTGPLPPRRDKSLIFLLDGRLAVRAGTGVYLPL